MSNFQPEQENTAATMREGILHHLKYSLARDQNTATRLEWWKATSDAARDRVIERMMKTQAVHNQKNVKRVYYLSLEFLMGRMLSNYLYNTGTFDQAGAALRELGLEITDMREEEYDMALGNGGLGRLAACFLDSLATLDYPAVGYGIYYEFGLFRQIFVNNEQRELPDTWLTYGSPWSIVRPEYVQTIPIYGEVVNEFDDHGANTPRWVNTRKVLGVPHDIPIPGFGTGTVNFLRLWQSKGAEDFNLAVFNEGGYVDAMREKNFGETISKVLYPNDKTESGKELRLVQQYFFVACSLQDIMRRFLRDNSDWNTFPEKAAIQLNDTHPSVAVPELLRILMDDHKIPWGQAWDIACRTFAYTNHTLLPEALEKWSVPLFRKVLPRHLQIIFDINKIHLAEVEAKWPGDNNKKRDLSLIEEGYTQMVRMAHLSVVGSHSVNGVAALHTKLVKEHLFRDFNSLFPGRINNKTNGITPRRWLQACNPRLTSLITRTIGSEQKWLRDLGLLRQLEKHADNPAFQQEFMAIKHQNKVELANFIADECDVIVNPSALFDVQIKRLHEYKRQHLNLLHIVALYRRLLQNPDLDITPRVFLFGAKAAPGYELAKNIIRAINCVASKINSDTRIQEKLKVVFLPNYRVSLATKIIRAADLSEQISTAGKEASGTGNMKLALNGALTIGTLDGANVEIGEEVGDDNIFIFGLTVDEVHDLLAKGYKPWDFYNNDDEIKGVIDMLGSSFFTPGEAPGIFNPLRHSLLDGGDPYLVLADFRAYCDAQNKVDAAYRDKARWAKMAILNTARVGKFSSDRTIHEYAREIWDLQAVPV